MSLETASLPQDLAALQAFALALQAELKAVKAAAQLRSLEIEKLKIQLARLRRMQFGQSSERLDREIEQLELTLEELETTEAEARTQSPAAPAATGKARPHRRPLPAHLPREDVVHAPACTCPACDGPMACLGEDVTEVLDYVPGHFKVIRHVRPKYVCPTCSRITQMPAPALPTPRGLASAGLMAQVIVSKYADHLPLYRQAAIYARASVDLDRSTLADWVGQATWLMAPLVEAIRAQVFAADRIHGDDTPVPVLSPGRGRTRTGRLWTYVRDDRPFAGSDPPATAFFYSPDRKGERPRAHLECFAGFLQADGYAGFNELYDPGRRDPGPIIEVACWAHVRRKFFDVHEAVKSPIAAEALSRIGQLYAVEAGLRGKSAQERRTGRDQLRPLLQGLEHWSQGQLRSISTKSPLADAFRYMLKRWAALTRFLDDGRLCIDNNAAERAIRPLAIGRKNYLFAGSDNGGDRAAAMYTLIETARMNAVDPHAWLVDVLDRLAKGHTINRIGELLPWAWRNGATA